MSVRQDRHDNGDDTAAMTARLEGLEAAVERLAVELRTARLVVLDDAGTPRITAEVVDGVAELRVELVVPSAAAPAAPAVLVFAAPGEGRDGALLGPAIGVQLWAGGNGLAELVASVDDGGRWHAAIHVGASSGDDLRPLGPRSDGLD